MGKSMSLKRSGFYHHIRNIETHVLKIVIVKIVLFFVSKRHYTDETDSPSQKE